jgi:dipeptidyl aminopeptidase/acylaminoacyl peptidase
VLAYVRGAKIVIEQTTANVEGKTLQLRGRASSLRWSPDGTRLAFVSERGDHSIVGVYERAGGAVTWMAPGFGLDQVPCWSPDGTRVGFVRLPPPSVASAAGVERRKPYEIWVADSRTGKGSLAFRSGDASTDDAREVSLEWGANDRLVFVWERDGWARVHSLDPDGEEPEPLSPPGCEAGGPRPSADHTHVVFSANCGDPDRMHLWVAPLRGGAPRQLTTGRGIEAVPVAGARMVVFLAATSRSPETPHAVPLDGSELPRTLVPDALAGFPLDALVEPEPIELRARDGLKTRAQLFRRPDAAGRHPAVVFVHGGPSRQMLLGWHPMGYYHRAYAMNQHLASKGYVVLSVNYRGGVGYGQQFRKKRDAINAADYLDIIAAARYLQARSDVDPTRVAIWGGSHGGYLTALALARNSDLFAAGVDLAGMTSFILDIERWRSPVLVVHGDHDPTVPFGQTMELIRRLKALDRPPIVETLMLPDEQHMYLRHGSWLTVFEAASDFLDRHVGSAPSRERAAERRRSGPALAPRPQAALSR